MNELVLLTNEDVESRQFDATILGGIGLVIIIYVITTVKMLLIFAFLFCAGCPKIDKSVKLDDWKRKGKYYNFHHYKIFYIDHDGEYYNGETLLILHGYPTAGYDFHLMLPILSQRFSRIIIPDLLGYGFSDKPRNYRYSVIEYADFVQEFVNDLKLKSVHIMAHDFSASVAQELLLRTRHYKYSHKDILPYNVQIKSVVFLNPGGIFPEILTPIFLQQLVEIPVIDRILASLNNYYTYSTGLKSVFGESTQPSQKLVKDIFYLSKLKKGHKIHDKLQSFIQEFTEFEHRWQYALKTTKVPVSLIFGDADPVQPKIFPLLFKSAFRRTKVAVLKDIGHFIMLEAPIETAHRYFEFLDHLTYSQQKYKDYSPRYSEDSLWKYLLDSVQNHMDREENAKEEFGAFSDIHLSESHKNSTLIN